jgi:hypothetical protein
VLNDQLAFVQGDTWGGIPSITLTPHPNYNVASAEMQFRESKVAVLPSATLTTSDDSIIINDPVNWEFMIPVQNLPLTAGTYDWQFQTTDVEGNVQTYLQGTIQVYLDIVRP